MYYQSQSNDTVPYKLSEIFTNVCIAEQVLSCTRNNDIHQMEQYDTGKTVRNTCFCCRCTANKNSSSSKESGLVMGIVCLHIAHILQEYDLTDTCKYCRDNDRNNTCFLNRDTG